MLYNSSSISRPFTNMRAPSRQFAPAFATQSEQENRFSAQDKLRMESTGKNDPMRPSGTFLRR
jgi:hypothetical protein